MPLFNHFKYLAPRYDALFPDVDVPHWIQLLKLPVSGWLLDAGGGTGRIARHLASWVGGTVVCDESMAMLKQTLQKQAVFPTCCAVERLAYPDASFARILMVDAFHHLTDQSDAIHELYRVLEPGGILVIEEPDIRKMSVWGIALFEKLALMRSHFRPADWIGGKFKQMGASVSTVVEGSTFWLIVEKPL
jgi:demethylmenaquinone methyltransferase/2-methoxy-6-polyprenyl-1,4-benzoquinol methylase